MQFQKQKKPRNPATVESDQSFHPYAVQTISCEVSPARVFSRFTSRIMLLRDFQTRPLRSDNVANNDASKSMRDEHVEESIVGFIMDSGTASTRARKACKSA